MPIFLLVPSTRASNCGDDLETIVLHRIKCQTSGLVFIKETHWLHVNTHSVHPATAPLIFTSKQMTMSSSHAVTVQLSLGLQAALAVNIHMFIQAQTAVFALRQMTISALTRRQCPAVRWSSEIDIQCQCPQRISSYSSTVFILRQMASAPRPPLVVNAYGSVGLQ